MPPSDGPRSPAVGNRNISTRSGCLRPTLDRLPQGVLIVDAACRLLSVNQAGEQLLCGGDGLIVRHSKLHASFPSDSAALHKAVGQATAPATHDLAGITGRAIAIRRTRQAPPLTVTIAPLRTDALWFARELPAAILFVDDPEREPAAPAADRLRAHYGLTPTEARMAVEIVRGQGLQAAADALRITAHTARTHLQRVFDKTGVRRQTELIRLLGRIVG